MLSAVLLNAKLPQGPHQMNFPQLSVGHDDIICRINTVPVTTKEIKHSSQGKKIGGSTVQVKQEHSGVPALCVFQLKKSAAAHISVTQRIQ